MHYKLLLSALISLTILSAQAQNSSAKAQQEKPERYSWWEYGINVGAYIPDNYAAGFYNGEGDNDISYILDNQYYREDIEYDLSAVYTDWELPQNMKYDVSTMPGLHLEYHRDSLTSFFVNFQYVKLQTSDVFKLNLLQVDLTFDNYVLGEIYGEEERIYIDLGIRKYFSFTEKSAFYVLGAVNINNTTVQLNKINIGTQSYSIKTNYSSADYIPGYETNTYDIKQGDIGFGGAIGVGGKFYFQNNVYAAIDLTGYYTQTVLPNRDGFAMQIVPLIRLGYHSKNL